MIDNLFIIQIITSLIVGGGIITILTLIAEQTSSRTSGIILAFPSTTALGFFFLGWTTSATAVAEVVPTTLIPLGLATLFPVIYIYVAKTTYKSLQKKIFQIFLSFTISTIIWLIIALPMAYYRFSSFMFGITGYFILIIFSHFLLNLKKYTKPLPIKYSFGQIIGRAVFVGLIIVLVVFLGKTVNPFWGGIFAMFPASFSSSLMIFHWYYTPKSLFPTIQKAAIGNISVLMYSLTVMVVFPSLGFILGTFIAYLVSLFTTLVLIKAQSLLYSGNRSTS